jgi:dihydroorotate dehydrogenase (fumarate)
MDLSTKYLGLDLRSPLVASAGPVTATADRVRKLADAGVGAVVLPSLFEEQLRHQADRDSWLALAGTDSYPRCCGTGPGTPRTCWTGWPAGCIARASAP